MLKLTSKTVTSLSLEDCCQCFQECTHQDCYLQEQEQRLESCQDFLKSHTAPPLVSHGSTMIYRTLLDIIHDEEPNGSFLGHKDKKSWKAFRDRLRLKRVSVAWTSTVLIPASDIPIRSTNNGTHFTDHNFNHSRSLMSHRKPATQSQATQQPPSSHLQRIRPPPLAHVSNRPPLLLNSAVPPPTQQQLPPPQPLSNAPMNHPMPFPRPSTPLSSLSPFLAVHTAAESPVSVYMCLVTPFKEEVFAKKKRKERGRKEW